jgi:hypothetical protein
VIPAQRTQPLARQQDPSRASPDDPSNPGQFDSAVALGHARAFGRREQQLVILTAVQGLIQTRAAKTGIVSSSSAATRDAMQSR